VQRYFKLPLDLTVAAWMGGTTPINKFVLTYVQQ